MSVTNFSTKIVFMFHFDFVLFQITFSIQILLLVKECMMRPLWSNSQSISLANSSSFKNCF